MRYLYTLLLALLGVAASQAETLTPQEAIGRLYGTPDLPAKVKPSGDIVSPALFQTIETASGEPAVYLFTSGSQILAVGANDVAAPLLGYGITTGEGDIPPQMTDWLNDYAVAIAYADSLQREGKWHRNAAPRRIQDRPAQIGPLLTCTWNQDDPFNRSCPRQDGQLTFTGCVATAMAQVMYYHRYPEKSTGEGTATMGDEQLTRSLNTTFYWDLMIDHYESGSFNGRQGSAVANLMVTCGFAVNMGYSTAGSGALSENVPRAFVNNFSYDKTAWLYYRDNYTLAEWEEMLITELEDNGPIYYAGASANGAHAFVCDGYDGDHYYHFNWGWGGYCDGYFLMDALDPSGQGIGGYEGGYNLGQSAMMGVRKPVEGSEKPEPRLSQGGDKDLSARLEGRTLTVDNGWYNFTYERAGFYIAFELEHRQTGELRYHTLFSSPGYLDPFWGYTSLSGDLGSSYPDGTYDVRVVTRTSPSRPWVRALCNTKYKDYVPVTFKLGTPALGENAPNIGDLTIDATLDDEQLYKDVEASYTITVTNTTAETQRFSLVPALVDEEGDMQASGKYSRFQVKSGTTLTSTVKFTLEYEDTFRIGEEYELVLYNPSTKEIKASLGKVTVADGTGAVNIILPDDGADTSPVYYNTQGIATDRPGSGIWLRRTGNTVTKVIIP